jgi:elongation factor G
VAGGKLVPIMAGSGLQNIGVIPLMDAIVSYLPSPKAHEVEIVGEGNKTAKIPADPKGALAALVFKTSADPYVGRLTYFRVYCGAVTSNSQLWNVTRGENERIGQLFILRGKNQEPVQEIGAGDIGAVAKLTVTATGDTLGTLKKNMSKSYRLFSPNRATVKLFIPRLNWTWTNWASLAKIVEEDPTLKMHREATTHETIISGIGEIQLSVAAEKMSRKFGVNVELQTPKVPYKETITMQCEAEYKHKKQTGGHGQYGHVVLELIAAAARFGNRVYRKNCRRHDSEELHSRGGERRT